MIPKWHDKKARKPARSILAGMCEGPGFFHAL